MKAAKSLTSKQVFSIAFPRPELPRNGSHYFSERIWKTVKSPLKYSPGWKRKGSVSPWGPMSKRFQTLQPLPNPRRKINDYNLAS